MSSKEVYRNFIQQAANQKKSIILWDAQRRYEGAFKTFDPSGDYVVLSDVTIVQPDAVMTVSELLLPLVSLKIVSAGHSVSGVATERAGVVAPPVLPGEELGSQTVYPSVSPAPETVISPTLAGETASSAEPVFPPTGEVSANEEVVPTLIPPLPGEEKTETSSSSEPDLYGQPPPLPGEPAVEESFPGISFTPEAEPPRTEEPLRIPTLEELMGVASQPASVSPAPPVESPLLSPAVSTPVLPAPTSAVFASPATEEAQPKISLKDRVFSVFSRGGKKASIVQDTASPVEPTVPASGPSSPVQTFQPSSVPRPQAPPASSYAVKPSDFEVKDFQRPPTRIVPPEVLAQKSAEVSASPFFQGYNSAPGQVASHKKKRDISTIILDIVIAVLVLIAIAIVVMGVLKIKMPFRLPFF